MLTHIHIALSSSTRGDWLAAMVLALAFVGCVEAPWIAGGLS